MKKDITDGLLYEIEAFERSFINTLKTIPQEHQLEWLKANIKRFLIRIEQVKSEE